MVTEKEFADSLAGMPGVSRVAKIARETVEHVVGIEDSIVSVSGGLKLENPGVGACAARESVFVVFCDARFPRPSIPTMEMVDDRGVTIGHDIPECMKQEFKARTDVIWIADSFVMYPSKIGLFDAKMVMHASRLECPGLPDGLEPWVFYPSVSSAQCLNSMLGLSGKNMNTLIVGVDGLIRDDSVPVSDVVEVPCGGSGHGESASEDTFY